MKISAKKIEKANEELAKISECLERIDFEKKFESSIDDLNLIHSMALNLRDYFTFLNNFIECSGIVKVDLEDFEKEVNSILKEISDEKDKNYGEIDDIKNYTLYQYLEKNIIRGIGDNKLILSKRWKKNLESCVKNYLPCQQEGPSEDDFPF